MKIAFQGQLDVKASAQRVYKILVDPKLIGSALPDVEQLRQISEDEFEAKVKVGVAFIKGSLDVRGKIVDKKEPEAATLVTEGKGLGSTVKIQAAFSLSEQGEMTRMKWNAEADISGLLTGPGERLIRAQADKVIQTILTKIKEEAEKA